MSYILWDPGAYEALSAMRLPSRKSAEICPSYEISGWRAEALESLMATVSINHTYRLCSGMPFPSKYCRASMSAEKRVSCSYSGYSIIDLIYLYTYTHIYMYTSKCYWSLFRAMYMFDIYSQPILADSKAPSTIKVHTWSPWLPGAIGRCIG